MASRRPAALRFVDRNIEAVERINAETPEGPERDKALAIEYWRFHNAISQYWFRYGKPAEDRRKAKQGA